MYKAIEIAPDIYWVGVIDWNERNFHGYTTDRGSTYNAYLIMDEKITLIDTCKPGFTDEMLERISQVVDPVKIDYIISNHVEQDHSGGIPVMHAAAPNAVIVTGAPQGVKGLTAHYGDMGYRGVKTGDTLTIGRRTLTFVQTTMVHWPDNMVTYDPQDRILFSNDAFGQHLAASQRFDDEVGAEAYIQARKYYANIVMPYSAQVGKALAALQGLEIDMIAPAHGIIWRSGVADILAEYTKWSSQQLDEYALVVYDSMWHTTEEMAESIVEAFTDRDIRVRLLDLKVNHISDIMTEVLTAKYLAVGSPTLNSTMMPTVASFLCYLKGLTPKGNAERIGLPFGSYGWAPKGPQEVAAGLEAAGFNVAFGIHQHQWTADDAYLSELRDDIEAHLIGADRSGSEE